MCNVIRALAITIFGLSVYGTVLASLDHMKLYVLGYSLMGIVASCLLCAATFSTQNICRENTQEIYTQVAIPVTPPIQVFDDVTTLEYECTTNGDEPDIENNITPLHISNTQSVLPSNLQNMPQVDVLNVQRSKEQATYSTNQLMDERCDTFQPSSPIEVVAHPLHKPIIHAQIIPTDHNSTYGNEISP